jgi:hypothetical protein
MSRNELKGEFYDFEKSEDYTESKTVIVPMEIFTLIHSHEFKLIEPKLTDKIMNEGLESLTEEENERLKKLQIDLAF